MNQNNPTNDSAHSFADNIFTGPSTFTRKAITKEFLVDQMKFTPVNKTTYHLRIEAEDCTAVLLSIDIVAPGFAYMTTLVSIRNERDGHHSVLPHRYQDQITKLVNALQGK